MARLFSKDYHDLSNSWYFNHAIIPLAKGDLWYWHALDEAGNYQMRFFPMEDKKEYFCAWLHLVYDPVNERVISHQCAECKGEETCRHYLSLLRYSYHYLSTDLFAEEAVQTCDGNSLRGDVRWLDMADSAFLALEGVYDPSVDKIRFYHSSYQNLDIVQLMKYLKSNTEISDELRQNYQVLDDFELVLFRFLNEKRAAYSAKGGFFSLYKHDFPAALALLERLKKPVLIKETAEKLEFATANYPLALRIEPMGKSEYQLSPVLVDEISVWYAGYPSWIFFRNKIHKVYLPFTNEVVDAIFSGNMRLSYTDLIYYRSIVHQELLRKDIYLDFDAGIDLPQIIDSIPKCKLNIKKLGDQILLEGYLSYMGVYEIPLSMLKFRKPLVYCAIDESERAWFYIPYQIHDKVENLLAELPRPEKNYLEQNAQLIFAGDAFENLQKAIFQLSDEEWEIEIDSDLRNSFITKIPLEVEITARSSDDIDWFSYDISYRYRDLKFTHEELKRFFRSKEEFIHTLDGRIFFISNPQVFQEVEALISRSEKTGEDIYRARILNLPYYQRLRQENSAFRMAGDEQIEQMFYDLQQRKLHKQIDLPYYLQTVLRGYQKNGVAWLNMLKHYHLNGILADEMGLGKTIQALTMILSAPEDTISMVVCPKTLLYNWAAEIEKFHTNIPYAIVEGSKELRTMLLKSPNIRLYIISYSMVLSDMNILKDMTFRWIVLDEAQNIKNVSAQRTSAIKKLKSIHRLALSGTPVENNLTELWSIMDFLLPGYLGSLKRFKEQYLSVPDPSTENTEQNPKLSLHRAISPFLLRRIKKEVLLELPDKQEQISWCKLSPIQEKLYMQIVDTVQKKLMPTSGENLSYVHILAALTKLRQVCNHPHLANNDILPEMELSSKLEQLVELVSDSIAGGHKVLVFSQFVQMLGIMRRVFDAMGIAYSYLDGQTKDRISPVQEFETNSEIRLFLISLKTGGTGLNLTSADTVILYDPWWNPMVENQAIDRTHRIGQTRKVQVFRLITKGTVEEKILALQQTKMDVFNEVIEGGNNVLKAMNLDELKGLFSY